MSGWTDEYIVIILNLHLVTFEDLFKSFSKEGLIIEFCWDETHLSFETCHNEYFIKRARTRPLSNN
jgi:hypothetical protein